MNINRLIEILHRDNSAIDLSLPLPYQNRRENLFNIDFRIINLQNNSMQTPILE